MGRWCWILLVELGVMLGCDDGGTPMADACGDGVCLGETTATCAVDCPASGPFCGDGVCNNAETDTTCARDCGQAPVCGDQVCNGTETTQSCAVDCPAVACTTTPNDCTGDTICISGMDACQPAYGRVYRVFVYDAVLTSDDATGVGWDVPGLPDPLVRLQLNNVMLGETLVIDNTLTPNWNSYFIATIPAGSQLDVFVEDYDTASFNDPMFSCTIALTADRLRLAGSPYVICAGTGALASAHVTLYFEAQ